MKLTILDTVGFYHLRMIKHFYLFRGSIIPGARFDPFGPPNPDQVRPGRRPPPDSDHMPPPGFGYDDMFS